MLEVAGRDLTVTSPDKVFFAERGETKLDLVRYYLAVAEPLMRAAGRAADADAALPARRRGQLVLPEARARRRAPEWLQTTIVSTPNGTTSRALVLADMAHVVWAVNLACLGFHVWPYLARPPRRRRRAAPRPRSAARRRLRRRPGGGGRAPPSARRARDRRLPEDDREPRPPRLRPARAAVGLLPGAVGRGRRRARARAPAPRADHGGVVEGGARPARLRRLQPERAAQDRLRRVVGARPAGAQVSTPLTWDEVDAFTPTS